ncbi:hypothetical protein [Actinophytocola sp.]|uniref:Rv0361 family membrane protein n=1 Tax=Actinophytocola sp. TaxID=1872138 RepID=UPI0025C1910E|nr:hypothetical protein [Actinophytocola sp.]
MPWILAGGGVVVIAVVVVLILALSGGSDTSSPEGVAESAVDAFNNQDADAIADLSCDATESDVDKSIDPEAMGLPSGLEVSAELGEVTKDSDTEASAKVTLTLSGDLPEGMPEGMNSQEMTLKMSNKDDKWCVDDLVPNI